jgi:phosphate transport system protein
MREGFHGELAELGQQLAAMCESAATAMEHATSALLTGDLALAEQVITADAELDEQRNECEERAQTLLALQAPVATDLRTVLAALYCTVNIERMGDLAAHIANTVRFSHPARAVPEPLNESFKALGELDTNMADHLCDLITDSADHGFDELNRTDDAVDILHADVLATITGDDWPHDVRVSTNLALLARFYERFADQAVSVAQRLQFAATGSMPVKG